MDPSLPTAAALAIAGDRIAGGVGTHETSLPTPGSRRPARPLRPAGVHRRARPLPDAGRCRNETSSSKEQPSLDEALARVAAHPRRGELDPRPRLARRRSGRSTRRARRSTRSRARRRRRSGRRTTTRSGSTPPALARAGGDLDVAGRRRRARRRRRADGHPARGVGVALPRPLRHRLRGRVRRRDARGHPARERARRRRDPRQGRLARRARDLRRASTSRDGLTLRVWQSLPHDHVGELAELRLRAGLGDDYLRLGYLKAFMDGTLGSQTAWMLDGSGVVHHERRGAGRDHPRGSRRRLARRRPRDRRPREPRGARRVRVDPRRSGRRSGSASGSSTRSAWTRPISGASPRSASPAPCSSATRRPTATWPSGSGATGSTARTRSGRSSEAARSSRTARTRRSRSSTRWPGSAAGVRRTIDDRAGLAPGRGA